MLYEDIKILARAGFTADEIRAMYSEPEAQPQEQPQEKQEQKPAEIKQEEKKEEQPVKKEAQSFFDTSKIIDKIDELTKAIQASNRLAVNNNAPVKETTDDILKQLIK